ncbi:hypothetical protein ZHAS_00001076 [Anopheles sinensis]|uniref:Uncharacterized protein n=1 Tax=Anopheles sinensis TaxID=74873 RepID=A0A084VB16_ANOSI|nr:hypothetical protein ZHAS_00001076 [Anopheles sinensis]
MASVYESLSANLAGTGAGDCLQPPEKPLADDDAEPKPRCSLVRVSLASEVRLAAPSGGFLASWRVRHAAGGAEKGGKSAAKEARKSRSENCRSGKVMFASPAIKADGTLYED